MKLYRITVHCSDSPNGRPVSADEIRQWHLARGFNDIGYHFVIGVDGRVEPGRPIDQNGAHVEGENRGNVGIVIVGKDQFTPAQWTALRGKLDSLILQYDIKKSEIWCHRQFPSAIQQGKTCPGFEINALLCWYFLRDDEAIRAHILGG